jgi:hypothetical protein
LSAARHAPRVLLPASKPGRPQWCLKFRHFTRIGLSGLSVYATILCAIGCSFLILLYIDR